MPGSARATVVVLTPLEALCIELASFLEPAGVELVWVPDPSFLSTTVIDNARLVVLDARRRPAASLEACVQLRDRGRAPLVLIPHDDERLLREMFEAGARDIVGAETFLGWRILFGLGREHARTPPTGWRTDPISALPESAVARRAALRSALPRAITRNEIEAHYQPRIRLSDRACVGAEALARWRPRDFGPISPSEFIPLAESTELVVPLGERVLRVACCDAGRWIRGGHPDFQISVNVSAVQLADPGFPRLVGEALDEAGLTPAHLELELTERILVEGIGACEETIHELRRIGVRFALDDFGTGFSGLSCLATLPIQVLKFDRSLVRDILNNPEAARLVRGITAMSKSLGFSVVAEGIDDPDALEPLEDMGCDEAQGFAIAEAMPATLFRRFLRERPKPDRS